MKCARCNGLMSRDEDNDWACIQCGCVKVVNAWRPSLVPASWKHTGTKRGPTVVSRASRT